MRKLRIPLVIDTQSPGDGEIPANLIDELYELHDKSHIRLNEKGRFLCYKCKEPVNLHSEASREGRDGNHEYHFQHAPGYGDNCDWKTYSGLSQGQIYNGIQEGKKHREMKQLLARTLSKLGGWSIDLDRVDSYFLFSPDKRQKGKPDVHAYFGEREAVFEIQLRSESPETIIRRKDFYRNTGRQLIWLSGNNRELVTEGFEDDCLEFKQVQKDIAFSNRGNLFLFNEKLAEESLNTGDLVLEVIYRKPELDGGQIIYRWSSEIVSYSKLTFEDGDTYYYDFFKEDASLKSHLREQGKQSAKSAIDRVPKLHGFSEFIKVVKGSWPTVDLEADRVWLEELYNSDQRKRVLTFKGQLLEFFTNSSRTGPEQVKRWNLLVKAAQGKGFGIYEDMDWNIVEKLLAILGHNLSPHKNRQTSYHCLSTHYFFDDYKRFLPYQELCLKAIELSPYKHEINNNEKVQKRLRKERTDIEQKIDLDDFLNWFASEPVLST